MTGGSRNPFAFRATPADPPAPLGAEEINPGTRVYITFDQPLDPASLSTSGFTVCLRNQAKSINQILLQSPTVLRLDVSGSLPCVIGDRVVYATPPGTLAGTNTLDVAPFDIPIVL